MGFIEDLRHAAHRNASWLCVGLDPDPDRLPVHLRRTKNVQDAVLEFNRAIVDATADLVCAYKPNSAFYEALGATGLEVLQATCAMIPDGVPIILDAKRGDVGHTAEKYAEFAFERMEADAVTLSPYLGSDSLQPFLGDGDRGVFLLCRTSNPSAGDLQDAQCDGRPLYQHVAELALGWQAATDVAIGLVAGATYPAELGTVRWLVGNDMPLLVPGVGAQSGDLHAAVDAAANRQGENAIFNASRSVLYASDGEDFTEAARRAASELRAAIQQEGGR